MGQSRTFQPRPVEVTPSDRPVFSMPSRPFGVTPPGPEETAAFGPAGGEGIRAPEPLREAPPLKLPPALPPAQAEMVDLEDREIERTESGSEPDLPVELRVRMEQAFRTNFSNVAVHRESAHAERLGALAYTRGNQIHFAPGQLRPETTAGQELIGHELAHVVQQRQGRVTPTRQLQPSVWINHSPQLEREAASMGSRAVRGEPAVASAVPSGGTAASRNVVQGAFTANALLVGADEASYDRSKVQISNLNMSKKKRPPTKLGARQGSHVVAWEAKVRVWSQLFVGSCEQVLGNLGNAAQQDEAFDENPQSKAERAMFLANLHELAAATLPLSRWNELVSSMITRYITIYQKSSFTVFGESSKNTPKGHGESSALDALGNWNQQAASSEALSFNDEDVFSKAAKLLDIHVSLPERTKVKGIRDWIDTLGRLFPNLFARKLLRMPSDEQVAEVAKSYSLTKLEALVKGSGGESMDTASTSLAFIFDLGSDASGPEDEALENEPFLATIQADLNSGQAQTFRADQIKVAAVALSDERPATQFWAGQGSHTIAWSLERRAWSRLFGDGQLLTEVLRHLEEVLTQDQSWAAKSSKDKAASERNVLKGEIEAARQNPDALGSLAHWARHLNDWIERYVTIYQKSPFATFSEVDLATGRSVPAGHGEGTALANLQGWENDPSLTPDLADVAKSALALLDVPAWQSTREEVGLEGLAERWWDDFQRAFPSVADRYRDPILNALMGVITSPAQVGVDISAPRKSRTSVKVAGADLIKKNREERIAKIDQDRKKQRLELIEKMRKKQQEK